jgi:hypothetical protein
MVLPQRHALVAALCIALAACAETRDFDTLDGVKTVTYALPQAHVQRTIRDGAQVGALVRYLNTRRTGWQPLPGQYYATPLRLKFFNGSGRNVAYVEVGTGGIVRSGFFRSSRLDETWKETRRLCRLLGRDAYRSVCGSDQMFGKNL